MSPRPSPPPKHAAKDFTTGHLSLPASGTVTCSPLPPVHLSTRFQALLLKPLPQVLRRELDRLEGHVRRGIEIEDHPVRVIDRIDAGAPGVQFDRAHLDDFQQAFLILDVEVFVFLALVPELEGLDVRAETLPGLR